MEIIINCPLETETLDFHKQHCFYNCPLLPYYGDSIRTAMYCYNFNALVFDMNYVDYSTEKQFNQVITDINHEYIHHLLLKLFNKVVCEQYDSIASFYTEAKDEDLTDKNLEHYRLIRQISSMF